MKYNDLFIRLLLLIDKKRKNLSHADFYRVCFFPHVFEKTYIIETEADSINIQFSSEEQIENFVNYDFYVLIREDRPNNLFIKPLNDFYNSSYFSIDNSLHMVYIECEKFYIPTEIIYNTNQQQNFIHPISESINILKGIKK